MARHIPDLRAVCRLHEELDLYITPHVLRTHASHGGLHDHRWTGSCCANACKSSHARNPQQAASAQRRIEDTLPCVLDPRAVAMFGAPELACMVSYREVSAEKRELGFLCSASVSLLCQIGEETRLRMGSDRMGGVTMRAIGGK